MKTVSVANFLPGKKTVNGKGMAMFPSEYERNVGWNSFHSIAEQTEICLSESAMHTVWYRHTGKEISIDIVKGLRALRDNLPELLVKVMK